MTTREWGKTLRFRLSAAVVVTIVIALDENMKVSPAGKREVPLHLLGDAPVNNQYVEVDALTKATAAAPLLWSNGCAAGHRSCQGT